MYLGLLKRMMFETDKRLLAKLAWNMGVKGMLSVERHKRRVRRGEFFPPFLYVSVINSCNLRCQGCWVDVAAKMEAMDARGVPPHGPRSEADGQRLLRHRRRRAVHAPAAVRPAGAASGLLFPDLHQRPFHHRRARPHDAPARQRHAADQRRGHRKRSATSAAAGPKCCRRRCRAWRTASSTRSSPASAPACARRTSTTC